jgi:hypothetical protein
MTNNRTEYEDIDDKTKLITESTYINPVFDNYNEVT